MSEDPVIRVMLVDDHEMVRAGVALYLASQPEFTVVGQAGNGVEAIALSKVVRPDVICMDLVMPGMDGLAAIHEIKSFDDHVQILAVTSFIDIQKVLSAIRFGAAGYLMKDAAPSELSRAIKMVARGEIYLHLEAARMLAQYYEPEAEAIPLEQPLTNREEEILKLVARGLNNLDIAEDLGISLKTVKVHLSNILRKLGLENRVQAAIYALQHNIVSLDDL